MISNILFVIIVKLVLKVNKRHFQHLVSKTLCILLKMMWKHGICFMGIIKFLQPKILLIDINGGINGLDLINIR
jgi:hypothetical protein